MEKWIWQAGGSRENFPVFSSFWSCTHFLAHGLVILTSVPVITSPSPTLTLPSLSREDACGDMGPTWLLQDNQDL